MLVPGALLSVVAACAGGSRPADGGALQALVDHHAPGIVLGEPPGAAARDRYTLRDAPYLGFRDSTYVGPDGVHDLMLQVDENVDHERARPSRRARVVAVMLRVDSTAVTRLDARVRSALGAAPVVTCRLDYPRGGTERRAWRASGDHGVLLLVPWDADGVPDVDARRRWRGTDSRPVVIFGTVPPDPEGHTQGPCSAATGPVAALVVAAAARPLRDPVAAAPSASPSPRPTLARTPRSNTR